MDTVNFTLPRYVAAHAIVGLAEKIGCAVSCQTTDPADIVRQWRAERSTWAAGQAQRDGEPLDGWEKVARQIDGECSALESLVLQFGSSLARETSNSA